MEGLKEPASLDGIVSSLRRGNPISFYLNGRQDVFCQSVDGEDMTFIKLDRSSNTAYRYQFRKENLEVASDGSLRIALNAPRGHSSLSIIPPAHPDYKDIAREVKEFEMLSGGTL